jgi:hypothetical protein
MRIRLHGTEDECRDLAPRPPPRAAAGRCVVMVTLISYQSSGGDQGRCDAKCYDATEPDCDCICGGRNHGAGKERAVENTRELAQSWVDAARGRGQDVTGVHVAIEALHDPLFPIGATR